MVLSFVNVISNKTHSTLTLHSLPEKAHVLLETKENVRVTQALSK